KETFDKYSNNIVNNRLKSKGISESVLTPFDIKQSTLSKQSGDSMAQGILNVLPTIIIIFMISPTIGIAADLIAGEKERGTFEPLLSTSAGRMSIFFGKLAAISSVALITLIVTLGSM
ncbi:ABC transporter permease subunit, partial [Clostridium tyrobutyricum]